MKGSLTIFIVLLNEILNMFKVSSPKWSLLFDNSLKRATDSEMKARIYHWLNFALPNFFLLMIDFKFDLQYSLTRKNSFLRSLKSQPIILTILSLLIFESSNAAEINYRQNYF